MDLVSLFRKRAGGEAEASSSRKKRKTKHKKKKKAPMEMVLVDETTDKETEGETPAPPSIEPDHPGRIGERREQVEEVGQGGEDEREAVGKAPYDSLAFSDMIFRMAGARADYGGLVNLRKQDATRTIRNMALQIALQSHILEEDVVGIAGEAAELNVELEVAKRRQEQLTMLIGEEKSKNEQMAVELSEAREALARAESVAEEERRMKEEAKKAANMVEARIRSEYEKGGERRKAMEEEVRKSGAFKADAYKMGMQLYMAALEDAEAKIPGQTNVFAGLRETAQKQLDNPISFPSEGEDGEEAGAEVSSGLGGEGEEEEEEEESEEEGGGEN